MINYKNTLVLLLASFAALAFNAQASEKEKNPEKSQNQEPEIVQKENLKLNVQKMMMLAEIQKAVKKDMKNLHLLKVFETLDTLIPQNDCIGIILHYGALDEQLQSGPAAVDRLAIVDRRTLHNGKLSINKTVYKIMPLENGFFAVIFYRCNNIYICKYTDNQKIEQVTQLQHDDDCTDLLFLPNNQIASAAGNKFYVWDAIHENNKKFQCKNEIVNLSLYQNTVLIKMFNSSTRCNTYSEYFLNTQQILDELTGDQSVDNGLFKTIELPNKMLIHGYNYGTYMMNHKYRSSLVIQDSTTQKILIAYNHYEKINDNDMEGIWNGVMDFAILPNNKKLISAGLRTIYVWDLSHLPKLIPECSLQYTKPKNATLTKVCALTDQTYISGDDRGFLHTWQRFPSHIMMAWQAYKEAQRKKMASSHNSSSSSASSSLQFANKASHLSSLSVKQALSKSKKRRMRRKKLNQI